MEKTTKINLEKVQLRLIETDYFLPYYIVFMYVELPENYALFYKHLISIN